MAHEELLKGNDRVIFTFRKLFCLDIVEKGIEQCFPTFFHIVAHANQDNKEMARCGHDGTA